MALSARREEIQPGTMDGYRTLSESFDTAAVRAALEKRPILLDPAVVYFPSAQCPLNNLIKNVALDGPRGRQPQPTRSQRAWC
ncbi:hypothetical_protein (plasmid) [Leishmania braziliensis MHOM/BR/75/M2904]|uniref:Hypothetical_protein n=1 Tax=Leishmania braziliensis MHOM/BR/75/M2904 TaxID=420245 RepID=A0A3P3YXN4_LEIBR|nr:unnamed protein product [Leishmania braziliensis]SYZ62660.1 hypothetical_protein [Leishmania braziliensis MHOM/BR/75/M2904]